MTEEIMRLTEAALSTSPSTLVSDPTAASTRTSRSILSLPLGKWRSKSMRIHQHIPKYNILYTKLQVKYWEFLELLCQEMGTKRRQQVRVYGNQEDIREYVKESCALVELDGEEQLLPMERIHKKVLCCSCFESGGH